LKQNLLKSLEQVDILENRITNLDVEILAILLKDRTTNKNIIWATDAYYIAKNDTKYAPTNPIEIDLITGPDNSTVIKPRIMKSQSEQKKRVREKAEVFTPSWVCNRQNNLVDGSWFAVDNVFNFESEKTWTANTEKINFTSSNKTWQDYVLDVRLEICCGEAPYLVSRYDTVDGKILETINRIGILDRKIRVINENTSSLDQWLTWVKKAYQSSYGYEWQGDSLLISRENLLYTFSDYFFERYGKDPEIELLKEISEIISWNIWQMDGIKCVVPMSCKDVKTKPLATFCDMIDGTIPATVIEKCSGCVNNNIIKHNGVYCKIRDWKETDDTKNVVRFVDLVVKKNNLDALNITNLE
jgi:hypothetical protein